RALDVGAKRAVKQLFADCTKRSAFRETCVREEDVDAAFELLHCLEQAVEVCEVRDVALNSGDGLADLLDGGVKLTLAAARDEDVRAFAHKLLRRREANAAIATSNECNFSFELTHVFLLRCHFFAVLCERPRFRAIRILHRESRWSR